MPKQLQNELKVNRIEGLSDGVFAIVMTLLILELKISDVAHDTNLTTGLIEELSHLWPKLFTYVVSFIILGVYWIGHHYQINFVTRGNRVFLWLNIVFLMFIGLVPFSTALLGDYPLEKVSVIIYGFNLVLCSSSLFGVWQYATRNKMVDSSVTKEFIKSVNYRMMTAVTFYIAGILVGLVSPPASLFIYATTIILRVFPGKVDRFWN